MEDGLATLETGTTENLNKNQQKQDQLRVLFESMETQIEAEAEYERVGWAGWNG
jgi:hypothetical protein